MTAPYIAPLLSNALQVDDEVLAYDDDGNECEGRIVGASLVFEIEPNWDTWKPVEDDPPGSGPFGF